MVSQSCWYEDVVGKHIKARESMLSPRTVADAKARGKARELETTIRELDAFHGRLEKNDSVSEDIV